MRVLVLCGDPGVPALGPSGSSAHLRGVVRALARRHEVRLAVPRLADRRGAVDEALDVEVITAEPRRWGWIPRRWRDRGELLDGRRLLRRATAGWRPDLIWERYSLFCDAGGRGPRGVPHLLEVNAPLSLERPDLRDRRWAEALEARILRRADRIVVVSEWLRRWAIARGCADDRVRHVPNGTGLPPGDRARGRAALGVSGLVVGFVGSMKPWHGLERLPALLDQLPDATGVLIGDGPTEVHHPRLRRAGRLAGAALADAVAALDVGLAPYPAEAPPWFCPLKVLDYRAQGVPVVASDVGDVADRVDVGEVLPAEAGPERWAAAVRRAAELPRVARVRRWDDVVDEALAGLLR